MRNRQAYCFSNLPLSFGLICYLFQFPRISYIDNLAKSIEIDIIPDTANNNCTKKRIFLHAHNDTRWYDESCSINYLRIPENFLHRWWRFEIGLENPDFLISCCIHAPWGLEIFSTEVFSEPEFETGGDSYENACDFLWEDISEKEDEEDNYCFCYDYLKERRTSDLECWALS
jgi:hypothetical protein